ncbi:DEAD/DEAH box helicase [Oleiharenicola lentus]|uniref:DEAD/DEAH box helicase n=1 Tax=Oleiharenicola lentus TaxID=2508720 RepID=UPI003F67724C
MPFAKLGLPPSLINGVKAMGYAEPTPIQLRAIPVVLGGGDLIGSAQTGTGKTAAFALPTLARLGKHEPRGPRVLILEPTRELAAQVETAFRDFGRFTDIRATVVHGGVGYGRQRSEIQAGTDIVIATPGRLMDFLNEKTLRLDNLKILILDEVDRMLDMGFVKDVKKIIAMCPKERQTLFFSATIPPEIDAIASFALRNPTRIEIGVSRTVNKSVTHAFYPVSAGLKFDLLVALLEKTDFHSCLVFSRTKHGADKIARKLKAANHSVAVLHANRSQSQRVEALEGFKSGKYEVMVATDIAARGIDVAGVSHVINYDIPANPEDYVHRIGRTGRAAAVGDAFTLTTPDQADDIRAIERFIGQRVPQLQLEGFDYSRQPVRPPMPAGGYPQHQGGHGQRGGHQGGQRSGGGQQRQGGQGGGGGRGQDSRRDNGPAPRSQGQGQPGNRPAGPQGGQGGQGGAQPAPRKFGGLSRGTWNRR